MAITVRHFASLGFAAIAAIGLARLAGAADSTQIDASAERAEALAATAGRVAPPSEKYAGGKGKCVAMELDGTVLVQESCPSKGLSHDYVKCGESVRERAKEMICKAKGKGTHKYLYRVSDNDPTTSSVFCK